MIKHLLKMVWNRKRINGLIMVEIFFSFVVLFVVVTTACLFTSMYRKPLGFSIERVWSIRIDTKLPFQTHMAEKIDGMKQVMLALKTLPEIESMGGIMLRPYDNSTSIHNAKYNGREVTAYINEATDGLKDALNVELTAGRWFSHEDDGSTVRPAVINEQLARDLYGDENPIGKETPFNKTRVVGVVRDFRKAGEFSQLVNYHITRLRTDDTTERAIPYNVILKIKPGVTAAFEERLVKTLESVEKDWTFQVVMLDQARNAYFKEQVAPLIAGGIVSVFLLIMVALGLVGVLWQNVTQRTKEIGLRRALGGDADNVSRQIHGEQFVITSLGVGAAAILLMQVPLLDLVSFIKPEIYFTSLAISVLVMYVVTHLCSLLPSWLAMDIQPAEALRYE